MFKKHNFLQAKQKLQSLGSSAQIQIELADGSYKLDKKGQSGLKVC